ncbi:MAG TPA: NUDIX hydrolase [archaeon]|nr:NUDIX hydrolase [archaeon]
MRTMVAAVIFDSRGRFLILKRKLHWHGWEFVKGRAEKETARQAVLREIREETGIRNDMFITKLPPEIFYRHENIHGHTSSVQKAFLLEYLGGKIRLSFEHSAYKWVDKKTAERLLTHRSHKIFLKYAYKIVKKRKKILIETLSKKHVRHVSFNGKMISLTYDGKRLRYKTVRRKVRDVGTWSRDNPVVYYDKNLDNPGVLPILIHEAVEKHVAQTYGLDVDTEAHKVAQAVEKEFIADRKWIALQKVITKAWVKTNKRKVGKTKFY